MILTTKSRQSADFRPISIIPSSSKSVEIVMKIQRPAVSLSIRLPKNSQNYAALKRVTEFSKNHSSAALHSMLAKDILIHSSKTVLGCDQYLSYRKAVFIKRTLSAGEPRYIRRDLKPGTSSKAQNLFLPRF